MVDLNKIAFLTGIPLEDIKKALGFSGSNMGVEITFSTLEEAREAYLRAPNGSAEQKSAIKQWKDFSIVELRSINSLETARCVHNRAPRGSAEQSTALRIWISFCSTLADAQAVYCMTQEGSEDQRLAIRKIATFFDK